MTNNVGFTFSIGDTTRAVFTIVFSKTNRIGDTNYNIQCSVLSKDVYMMWHDPSTTM